MPAILDVTIPTEIIPAMSSYPVGDIPFPYIIPGTAVVCGTVPAAIPIKVIEVTIIDNIIRAPHRYRKSLILQIDKTRTSVNDKMRSVPDPHTNIADTDTDLRTGIRDRIS